jgi:Tol biopolymer transport system component
LRVKGRGHIVWKDLSIKAERLRYLAPDQQPTRKLFAMSPDGKSLRELAAPQFGLDHLGSPEFSSDGSRIVMDMSRGSVSNSRIVMMNRDGSNMKDLGPGCMPSLSKDGKSIVFTDPSGGIVKRDADGQTRETIDRSGWGAQYSPDGKSIAVGSGSNMTLIDVKTGKNTLLFEGDVANRYSRVFWNFGWSHDSRAIAFKGQLSGRDQQELAVVDVNKPDQVEVLYSGNGIYEDFTFSQDSQSVLFALGQEGTAKPGLYLAHRKTPGQVERLKGQPDDRRILDCDWSPDGKEIVFAALVDPVPAEWPLAEKETAR